MSRYDDIIHLPHPTSEKYPRLSMAQRAAQFNPFAALTGYEEAVDETGRLTDEERFLDEESISRINQRLIRLKMRLQGRPKVSVCYFEPDEKKSGGAYRHLAGTVQKIDEYAGWIQVDGVKIDLVRIMNIEETA